MPLPLRRAVAALAVTSISLSMTGVALAQGQGQPDLSPPPAEGASRPFAPDTRAWHLFIDGYASLTGPTGAFASGIAASSLTAFGLNAGGALGLGVTRTTVVEIRGGYSLYAPPRGCSEGCSGRGYDIALGLRYHIAQGIAFDPWIGFGVGVRWTTFELPASIARGAGKPIEGTDKLEQVYRGIDVARITMGGSFFPVPFFGFGLYFEIDAGTNFTRPDPTRGLSPYVLFQLGARISFDPMRTGPSKRVASAAVTGY